MQDIIHLLFSPAHRVPGAYQNRSLNNPLIRGDGNGVP